MTIDNLASLIGSVGFPIAVALYLLVKLQPTIEKHTEALNSLKSAIQELCHLNEKKP